MSDKRTQPRFRKRFSLRFSELDGTTRGASRLAFTEDISRQGLFIKTANVARPGSFIEISLSTPAGEIRMEAKVMWSKKVQASFLQRIVKAGMGVRITRFFEGEALFVSLLGASDA